MSRILFTLYLVLTAIVTPVAAAGLPDVFDLRDLNGHSYIGPARDQGDCGGCYAFGALAAAESTYNRAMGLVDDAAVDLSESFILWDLSPYYEGFSGCEGTNYDYEELSGILAYGVVTESEFPYTYPDPEEDHLNSASRHFSEWYRIPSNDIETMKRVIYTFGALAAAVSVDKAFEDYSGGVFENSTQSVTEVLPYTTDTDHAIAIVGWNDEDGTWYLRNSWGEEWGEDGYMNIAYTSANVALEATYLTMGDWPGPDVTYENGGSVTAQPYTSGGVLNANAVDIWTGTKSRVINTGSLTASAVAGDAMAAARGIYLWGGPEVSAVNSGTVDVTAQSDTAQAIAYGISMQGSGGENSGTISARAASDEAQALAYGIQVFNGGSAVSLANSGGISSVARGDDGWAYGIWGDSRSSVSITNGGTISADGESASIGLLLSGNGVNYAVNTGTIQVSSDAMEYAIGIACTGQTDIVNTGIIDADDDYFGMAVYGEGTTRLTLGTGSDLTGRVYLKGDDDTLELTGEGSENSSFSGVENLVMNGTAWTLTSWFWRDPFESLTLTQGNLTLTAPVEISESGTLSGSGTLTADVTNSGRVSPGNSIGTLTIDGDYTQTATATMALEAGGGTSDLLAVTGTADIQGGSLALSASGYLTSGTYEFLRAGTLDGSFDTLTTPAMFEAALTTDPSGSLSLAVTRSSYESIATPDQAGLASALDASWPLAAGEMADMLTRIDNMAALSSVRSALGDLAPGFHSAVAAAALDNAVARIDRIQQHLYETLPQDLNQDRNQDRHPGLNRENNPWQFWASGTALDRRYDRTPESPEVRARLEGTFFGLDRRVGPGLAIGAAGAYSRTDVHDMNGASTATVDSFNGYLYATLDRAGFHAEAVAGIGQDQYETDRTVPFLGRTASSEHNGWQASALLGGGYDWRPGGWTLGPIGSLQYLYLDGEGFSEEGAGGADLHLDTTDSEAWLATLGFRAVRPILLAGKNLILPGIRVEWLHALSQDTDPLSASFLSTGQDFSVSTRDPKDDLLKLNVSLTAVMTPDIRARIHYLRLIQGDGGYTAHQIGAGFKVLF